MKFLDGTSGLAGWQWLFLIEGVPSLVLGGAVVVLLDDRIADAKWLNPVEEARWTALIAGEKKSDAYMVGKVKDMTGSASYGLYARGPGAAFVRADRVGFAREALFQGVTARAQRLTIGATRSLALQRFGPLRRRSPQGLFGMQ